MRRPYIQAYVSIQIYKYQAQSENWLHGRPSRHQHHRRGRKQQRHHRPIQQLFSAIQQLRVFLTGCFKPNSHLVSDKLSLLHLQVPSYELTKTHPVPIPPLAWAAI